MVIVAIGAADQVAPPGQGRIGQQRHPLHPDGAERARPRAHPLHEFLRHCLPQFRAAQFLHQFGLAEAMVAAQQHQHRFAIGHHHQALHLRALRQAREGGQIGDGFLARSVKLFRFPVAFRVRHRGRRARACGRARRGAVGAARAGHHRIRTFGQGQHEAAFHSHRGQGAAFQNPHQCRAHPLRRVAEGVDFQSGELPHAQERRLHAEPDLRQQFGAAQFAARDFRGGFGRQSHLLPARRRQLFPREALNPGERALPERQIAVDPA